MTMVNVMLRKMFYVNNFYIYERDTSKPRGQGISNAYIRFCRITNPSGQGEQGVLPSRQQDAGISLLSEGDAPGYS